MARRRFYGRRRMAYRRPRRRSSSKKNIIPTKIPMSLGSAKYQWRRLGAPSKAAVALLIAGAVIGPQVIAQVAPLPFVGRYAAQIAMIGAKFAKKM